MDIMVIQWIYTATMWCPRSIAFSWGPHNSNFTFGLMVDISNYSSWDYKPTNITGGHHLVVLANWVAIFSWLSPGVSQTLELHGRLHTVKTILASWQIGLASYLQDMRRSDNCFSLSALIRSLYMLRFWLLWIALISELQLTKSPRQVALALGAVSPPGWAQLISWMLSGTSH